MKSLSLWRIQIAFGIKSLLLTISWSVKTECFEFMDCWLCHMYDNYFDDLIEIQERIISLQIFLILPSSSVSRFNWQGSGCDCIKVKCQADLRVSVFSCLLIFFQGHKVEQKSEKHRSPWHFLASLLTERSFRLASLGLLMLCDACMCEWGCDNVCDLMSFYVVHEKGNTCVWSAFRYSICPGEAFMAL